MNPKELIILRKLASSLETRQLGSQEQQKIEPSRKTDSSPQARQLLWKEHQKGDVRQESNYGSSTVRKLDSPMKNSGNLKQAGFVLPKEQVVQESINRESNSTDTNAAKVTNRRSGHPLEDQPKGVLNQQTIGGTEKAGLSFWKGKQRDVFGQESMRKDDKYEDNSSLEQVGKLLEEEQQNGGVRQERINKEDMKTRQNHTDINTSSIGHASKEQQKVVLKQDYSNESRRDTRQESNKNLPLVAQDKPRFPTTEHLQAGKHQHRKDNFVFST